MDWNRDSTVGNVLGQPWRIIEDAQTLTRVTTRPAYRADDRLVDQFQEDGFVVVRDAFSPWVDALCEGLERNLESPSQFAFPCDSTKPGEPGRFFDSYCNWQRIPEYLTFVLSSPAAAMAAQFMRSESAQLFHDHAFCKEAGTRKPTPWHHDMPYYCVDGSQTVSIYVALDAMGTDTAIQFVKRSHRSGQLHLPRAFSDGAYYKSDDPELQPVPEPAEADVFCEALEPGDTVLFDFRTLHGSGAAPTKDRRRAFSTRWLGDDAVYVDRPGETSPPLEDLGLMPGDRLRPDWFPVLWP